MCTPVSVTEWSRLWHEAGQAYEQGYLKNMRRLGRAVPLRFCVGGFGFGQRFVDRGLLSQQDVLEFRRLIRNQRWTPIYGSGPRGMFGSRHRELQLDALGSLCGTYIANNVADVDTLLQVAWVLQASQKVHLARKLGRHTEFEYFLHPASMELGYYPRMICVGEVWRPLARLMDRFAAWGCIREEDKSLFVHVPDMPSAVEEARKDYERFVQVCSARGLSLTTHTWNGRELDQLQRSWCDARDAYQRGFLSKLRCFARRQEPRIRVSAYGSHMVSMGNGEVSTFGEAMHDMGLDMITGGGPKVMQVLGQGFQSARAKNGHPPTAADDERLLAGPRVLGLTLALPDEQRTPSHLDLEFPSAHFWRRLMGFWTLSAVHFAKRKGGLGTLLEIIVALQKANAVEGARRFARLRGDQALLNPLCGDHYFVPHVIALGDLWREIKSTLRYMRDELGSIPHSHVDRLRVHDSLDGGLEQVSREVCRIRRHADEHGYELVAEI